MRHIYFAWRNVDQQAFRWNTNNANIRKTKRHLKDIREIGMFFRRVCILRTYCVVWKDATENKKCATKPRNKSLHRNPRPAYRKQPKYDIKCFQQCTIKIIILRCLYDFIRSDA